MSDLIHIGTRKGLFTFERDASGWKQTGDAFLGIQVPMFFHDRRHGLLHAAVEHGHFGTAMHRSADGGKTWQEMSGVVYPEKPADAPDILDPFRQTPVPWSLEKIWSLESGGPDRPNRLWCGTIPGGLFRSDDSGENWQLIESLWGRPERAKWVGGGYDFPGIHSICVHPENSDRIAVGVSCGGVWLSEDAGESWQQGAHGMVFRGSPGEDDILDPEGQDPHRMVRCHRSPERLWVQHHCTIYRSDDGAHSWQELTGVKPSGFGFAVAVHPADPDTAWFVPAKKDEFRHPVDARFVVTRTRDGGNSFEVLAEGLPQPPCYDLVYRHGLDIDPSGERLVMGSTTGSLWISEDQGDSWQLLTSHLPPIYCVRFA